MTTLVRERGKRGLLMYYKKNHPQLYARIRARLPDGISAFGLSDPASVATEAAPTRSWADNFTDAIKVAAQGYLTVSQAKAQEKIADMQLKRAVAGQPPLNINTADYGLSPQVSVGVTSDTKQLVIYALAGLAAVYVGSQLLKRR